MAQRSCDWNLFKPLERRNGTLLGDQKWLTFLLRTTVLIFSQFHHLLPSESHLKGRACNERAVVPNFKRGFQCPEKQRLREGSHRFLVRLLFVISSVHVPPLLCVSNRYQKTTSWWWLSFPSRWQTSPSSKLEIASRLSLIFSGISAGLCFSKMLG